MTDVMYSMNNCTMCCRMKSSRAGSKAGAFGVYYVRPYKQRCC